MPKQNSEQWVVEFSQSQQAFHVQDLGTAAKRNLKAFRFARPNDYSIIAVFSSEQEASTFVHAVDIRKNRRKPFTEAESAQVLASLKSWSRSGKIV